MIRFACPGCSKPLKAPEDKAGVTMSCPGCRRYVQVPNATPQPRPTATRREPPRGVTCPGCGRFIPLGPDEWALTLECAQCDTRFRPGDKPTATPTDRISVPAPPEPDRGPDVAPPPAAGTAPLRPHRGTLILMLGIMSLCLPFPLGPLAWRLGRKDLKAMQDGEMDPDGMDLTTYGKRFGMSSTILAVGYLVFLIVMFSRLLGGHPGQSLPGLPQLPNLDDLGKGL
jgi:hypothetical protein